MQFEITNATLQSSLGSPEEFTPFISGNDEINIQVKFTVHISSNLTFCKTQIENNEVVE